MTKRVVRLDDRYSQERGQVLLTSMQAFVRLMLDQARSDRLAGLATGGYVTGYRGSPITTLDAQFWSARSLLDSHDIHFEPGLNEELAATSLRGTQQLEWFGPARVAGIFAMWYAKGLGVDRAIEAIKIANLEGAHRLGGVLINAGDDPSAKSSATAHQSEQALISAMVPVLAPSTTEDILTFGRFGWAMSRYSGLYVAMKTVTDGLDLTSTVSLPAMNFTAPDSDRRSSLNIQKGRTALEQERLVIDERLPAAVRFGRHNDINRIVIDGGERPKLVIVTGGRVYLDVRQSLADLGLGDTDCSQMGIRMVKLGLIWPLDSSFLRDACEGARSVLVIEEKRPVIEEQIAAALYGIPGDRPWIAGKRDASGAPLLPSHGVLDPSLVRHAILRVLEAIGSADVRLVEIARRHDMADRRSVASAALIRPAYFCSGCPHNVSTLVPEGSKALGATGCHGLAVGMPERNTMTFVGMGAEGTPWIGAQHFSETRHVFANMGDGTYNHSGVLAIRAATAAGARMTFKILYNDAVAMTGGQPIEGNMQPEQIVLELLAEGVAPVVLVSDEPGRFAGRVPRQVPVHHRDDLDRIQQKLRDSKGVSAIVYEQVCANEKRRRRKRGTLPDPPERLFINPDVCEGCGDCSVQSNCVSILPLDTGFGRKREIDQSNCNKDYSCIKGFCPSFVTLRGAEPARRSKDIALLDPLLSRLPGVETIAPDRPYSIIVAGIGGTGVLTVGAVLAMAAHIEGKACTVLDMTGMAQKGGGVASHIRIAPESDALRSARLGTGEADLLVACDLVVGSGPDVTRTLRKASHAIVNDIVVPTGEFQHDASQDLDPARFLPAITRLLNDGNVVRLAAIDIASSVFGNAIFANMLMIGYAAQKGLLPVGLDSIEQAIRVNGAAVEMNLQAITVGRLAANFPEQVANFCGPPRQMPTGAQTLTGLIASRHAHLSGYADSAYADRYSGTMATLAARLGDRGFGEDERLLLVIAEQLARLMAYKDEYEVARLYTHPAFRKSLREKFKGDYQIAINLAPPLLSFRKDRRTGEPRKIAFGGWILPLLSLMARLKFLRGTPFDIFGYTRERRMERALIEEYVRIAKVLVKDVSSNTMPLAIEIAAAADAIRGFGSVKERGVRAFREQIAALFIEFNRQRRIVA